MIASRAQPAVARTSVESQQCTATQARLDLAHVIEPPDLLLVEVLEALPGRPISRRTAGPSRRHDQPRLLRRRRGGRPDASRGQGEDRASPAGNSWRTRPSGWWRSIPRPGSRRRTRTVSRSDRPQGHRPGLRGRHRLQQPQLLHRGRGRRSRTVFPSREENVFWTSFTSPEDYFPMADRDKIQPDPQLPQGIAGPGPAGRLRRDHHRHGLLHELPDPARRPDRRARVGAIETRIGRKPTHRTGTSEPLQGIPAISAAQARPSRERSATAEHEPRILTRRKDGEEAREHPQASSMTPSRAQTCDAAWRTTAAGRRSCSDWLIEEKPDASVSSSSP